MREIDLSAAVKALSKNRYVLLILCVGLGLLLLPRRASGTEKDVRQADASGMPMAASGIPVDTECTRISALLRTVRGIGDAEVLLSAQGCVVVCEGADSAAVRLDVTNAVAAYTGLGSDKICVMKMMKISGGNAK